MDFNGPVSLFKAYPASGLCSPGVGPYSFGVVSLL